MIKWAESVQSTTGEDDEDKVPFKWSKLGGVSKRHELEAGCGNAMVHTEERWWLTRSRVVAR